MIQVFYIGEKTNIYSIIGAALGWWWTFRINDETKAIFTVTLEKFMFSLRIP